MTDSSELIVSKTHRCLTEEAIVALASGACAEQQAEALLAEAAGCAECSLLLGEAGRAVAEEAGDETDLGLGQDGSPALEPGATIAGRFRVLRLLGQGGMGEVYSAVDTELGETIALKTIRSGLASAPSTIQRFRQEARLARRVVHPNVCRVLEFGRHDATATPVYFLTMELLRGVPLSRHLRERRRLSALEATDIVLQLSAGLGAIHDEGVLHRDIKSSNIMLCSASGGADESRRGQRAVLLDFGVAGALQSSEVSGDARGQPGTPSYMAPEQLQGAPLSTATDVFALGVVLYELLVGKLPFGRAESRTAALENLRLQRARGLDELSVVAPKRLARLVTSCLLLDPKERLDSARQLERELAAVRRELCAPAAPPAKPEPAQSGSLLARLGATSPRLVGLVALFGSAALLAALGVARSATRPVAAPPSSTEIRAAAARSSTGWVAPVTASTPLPSNESPPVGAPAAVPRAPISRKAPTPNALRSAVPKSSASEPSDCSPPYHFDAEGFRVYRKECL